MKQSTTILSLAILFLFSACETPKKGPKTLPDYFKEVAATDTMRFEVAENEEAIEGDTIPNALFFSQLETKLMNDVNYLDNSGDLMVFAKYRFPFNENTEVWLVDMRQNWYKHLSLFLYDKKSKTFIDRQTVAEFYGGEGGQILTGSWLVDIDGDGKKEIVRRQIEHWLKMDENGGDPIDLTVEHVSLLNWNVNKFEEMPVKDSADMIQRFPIKSYW